METIQITDFGAIKAKQQATWATGDYGQIGVRLQIVGETLCETVDVQASERVLDVAGGNGNSSLAAARRFAQVTCTDYVEALLDHARIRAAAERLPVRFEVADAEALPYEDGSFDVVLSSFGVMFTPDQRRAAAELLRVVRPGGRIGLASWTPEGFLGEMFRVVGAFAPPPAGIRSPMVWGSETGLVELFGPGAADIRTERKTYNFRYASEAHFVDFFRTYYGPVYRAFGALDENGRRDLAAALGSLLKEWNHSTRGALVVPAEYLEAVITR
jgi:SAM-dependent methyltransferase